MKITTTQLNPKTADLEHNFNQMIEMIISASQDESKLIIFPELALTGCNCEEFFDEVAITKDSQIVRDLAILASSYDIVIIFGSVEKNNGEFFNSAFIIDTDKSVQICRTTKFISKESKTKDNLTKLFTENRYYEPDVEITPINCSLGKVGILLSHDVFKPDLSSLLAKKGADFFIVLSGLPKIESEILESILLVRSIENDLPLIYSNLVGDEGETTYCGGSCIIQTDKKGVLPDKVFTTVDDFQPKMLTSLLHI